MAGERTADERGRLNGSGRLASRPDEQAGGEAPAGLYQLGIAQERDALLYVPAGYRPDQPAPLAVMLHGANGGAERGLTLLRDLADHAGLILLAPASRDRTWDVLSGEWGDDVALIDNALAAAFARLRIDRSRLAIGGFSDGASYALSLGLRNGDLFSHVVAFSPGFAITAGKVGSPRMYVSHGRDDAILPIDLCSRRVVPLLWRAGCDVTYREFDGPHTVPPDIAAEAIAWFLAAGDGLP